MTTPHIVWDWNGTLLDDRSLLIGSVLSLARDEGVNWITAEIVTARFARPLRRYFENVLDRTLTSAQWVRLEARFHQRYREGLAHAPLARGARDALEFGRLHAAGQSLLSLWPHTELIKAVDHHGIGRFFDDVRGRRDTDTPKSAELLALLEQRELAPDQAVLIGDTTDDVAAARTAGMRSVLVTGGSLGDLDTADPGDLGAPVVRSLLEAVELVCPTAVVKS